MKTLITLLLLITTYFSCYSQQKGDSLAILYYPVYAYHNPNDFSTRYHSIFSFQNKKIVFIEESNTYSGYFKVKTGEGDTVYVKANRLAADPKLSPKTIIKEIQEGKRNKEYSRFINLKLPDYPYWYYWIAYFVVLLIAYILYRNYYKFDRWYCRKTNSRSNPLYRPLFLTYPLAMGLISGVIQFFSPQEYKWFWSEGFQIWGKYPSNWDYVMWATVVITVFVGFIAVIQAFRRFSPKYAVLYSIISLIMAGTFFYIGYLTSGLAIAVFFLRSFGSGNSIDHNDGMSVGTYRNIDGINYVKNANGMYEQT
jgi:hypothetical protein